MKNNRVHLRMLFGGSPCREPTVERTFYFRPFRERLGFLRVFRSERPFVRDLQVYPGGKDSDAE